MACSCCVLAIYLSQSNENEMTFFPAVVPVVVVWLFVIIVVVVLFIIARCSCTTYTVTIVLANSHLNYIVLKSNSSIPPSAIYAQMEKKRKLSWISCARMCDADSHSPATTDYRHDNKKRKRVNIACARHRAKIRWKRESHNVPGTCDRISRTPKQNVKCSYSWSSWMHTNRWNFRVYVASKQKPDDTR